MLTTAKHISLLLLIFSIYSIEQVTGQCSSQWPNYNMANDTVEECKANFFDEGGLNNDYSNNTVNGYTTDTFVIETADTICLTFTSFDIEIFDTLMIDATCNGVFVKYTGNTLPPQTISTCGFITIVFKYDHAVVKPGWAACWTTKLKDLEPPDMDANPVPSCNDNTVTFDLTGNVPCDSIYGTDWVIKDYLNQIVPVTNAIGVNCTNDSTNQVQVTLGGNGIEENCDYTVDWELRLTDRCDSTWIFNVLDTFYVTDCPFPVDITGDTIICPGGCTDLEAVVPGCLSYLYAWSPNIGNGPGPYNVCPSVTTTYSVTVTDSTGNAPATIESITIEIVDPEITEPNTINLCQTDPPYTLSVLNPGGWWIGAGSVDSSSLNGTFDPSKDSVSAGCHVVRYYVSPSCYDSITICVDSIDAGFDEAACPDSAFQVGGNWGLPTAMWSDTGGYITSAGFFNTPSTPGVYEVILTDPVTLCTDTKLIYVDPITVQPKIDTICQSNTTFVPNLQPPGGILTGPGVVDTVLHIVSGQVAGPGTHVLTYSLHGCSTPWIIEVLPVDAGPNQVICPGHHDTLVGTPFGGFWTTQYANTGNSVGTNSGEVIIDVNSNDDNILVAYHAPNGCIDYMWLYVRATKIGPDTLHFCEGDPQLILNFSTVQRTPSGGTWTGNGIVGNLYFYPTVAGVGEHMIYYAINGCADSCLMIVYPNDLPLDDTVVCSAQAPFLLDSVIPGNGYWTGSGIIDAQTGLFDPGVALIDTFYVYWNNQAGCSDSVLIMNYQYFDASINGMDSVYCYVDSNYVINYVPSNDTVFVDGVPATTFNPAVVDTGWHILTLDFGPSAICYNADTLYIYVKPPIATTLTLDDDTICRGDGTTITVSANGGDSLATYYSYAWSNNTANTSNVNNVGPDTTTTYYVTTSDGCSDPIIDTVTVNVAPPIEVEMLTSEKICYGDTGFAFANVIVPDNYSVTWNTNPVQYGDSIVSTAGEFINFEITDNGFGCKFDSTVKIPSWLPVSAVFLVNPNEECIAYEFKDDLNIIDLSNNATTGTWEFSNGDTEPYVLGINPAVPFDKAGQYSIILRVENEGGCPDSMEINVCIDDKASYFIPDAFSPNGDGLNDILYLRAKNIDKVKFVIYGRWGEKIFETEDIEEGWDGEFRGKPMNSGIFVYYADIIFVDGRREVLKGDVSLVR